MALLASVPAHPPAIAHGRVTTTTLVAQGGEDLATCRRVPVTAGAALQGRSEAAVPSGILLPSLLHYRQGFKAFRARLWAYAASVTFRVLRLDVRHF